MRSCNLFLLNELNSKCLMWLCLNYKFISFWCFFFFNFFLYDIYFPVQNEIMIHRSTVRQNVVKREFGYNNQIVNADDAHGECFKRKANKRNLPRNYVFGRERFISARNKIIWKMMQTEHTNTRKTELVRVDCRPWIGALSRRQIVYVKLNIWIFIFKHLEASTYQKFKKKKRKKKRDNKRIEEKND